MLTWRPEIFQMLAHQEQHKRDRLQTWTAFGTQAGMHSLSNLTVRTEQRTLLLVHTLCELANWWLNCAAYRQILGRYSVNLTRGCKCSYPSRLADGFSMPDQPLSASMSLWTTASFAWRTLTIQIALALSDRSCGVPT